MWVKICGLAIDEQVSICAALGFDALGLLLADPLDPKPNLDQLSILRAKHLRELARDLIDVVLLVKPRPDFDLQEACSSIEPEWLQLQADFPLNKIECIKDSFPSIKLIKKVGIKKHLQHDDVSAKMLKPLGDGLYDTYLIDTEKTDTYRSGTGKPHNWLISQQIVMDFPQTHFVLAGGLSSENVETAISTVRPWGVDVMTHVSCAPGHKNIEKASQFLRIAKNTILS